MQSLFVCLQDKGNLIKYNRNSYKQATDIKWIKLYIDTNSITHF